MSLTVSASMGDYLSLYLALSQSQSSLTVTTTKVAFSCAAELQTGCIWWCQFGRFLPLPLHATKYYAISRERDLRYFTQPTSVITKSITTTVNITMPHRSADWVHVEPAGGAGPVPQHQQILLLLLLRNYFSYWYLQQNCGQCACGFSRGSGPGPQSPDSCYYLNIYSKYHCLLQNRR